VNKERRIGLDYSPMNYFQKLNIPIHENRCARSSIYSAAIDDYIISPGMGEIFEILMQKADDIKVSIREQVPEQFTANKATDSYDE
jgi:hypothetical protein